MICLSSVFFFQAEDGIRDLVRSRGLGDVYKRQKMNIDEKIGQINQVVGDISTGTDVKQDNMLNQIPVSYTHLTLPTSDLV